MGVGRGDQPGGVGPGPAGDVGTGKAGAPRPTTHVVVRIPADWPEARIHEAGRRLASTGADEVSELVHVGLPIDGYLTHEEREAVAELGEPAWRRWWWRGWSTAAADLEGG